MKLKKNAVIASVVLSAGLLMVSLAASAGNLSLANNSKNDLELCFQDVCSTDFMVEAHSIKVVPEAVFNKACGYNKKHCLARVYVDNSSFRQIATIGFDTAFGVQSITGDSSDYSIGGSGFNLFLNGSWMKK